jgi:hypothetical protein
MTDQILVGNKEDSWTFTQEWMEAIQESTTRVIHWTMEVAEKSGQRIFREKTIEQMVADATLNGEIVGKNVAERKAKALELFFDSYVLLDVEKAMEDFAKLQKTVADIEYAELKMHMRLAELCSTQGFIMPGPPQIRSEQDNQTNDEEE